MQLHIQVLNLFTPFVNYTSFSQFSFVVLMSNSQNREHRNISGMLLVREEEANKTAR